MMKPRFGEGMAGVGETGGCETMVGDDEWLLLVNWMAAAPTLQGAKD